eukprot:scaffold11839_cov124-Isochrysis_galbana.AAC.5
MRLLHAKDRLSTLDHEGSDQPPQRPKMVHRKSNQSKKKSTATLRSPCAGSVLRTGPCTLRNPSGAPRSRDVQRCLQMCMCVRTHATASSSSGVWAWSQDRIGSPAATCTCTTWQMAPQPRMNARPTASGTVTV